MLCGVSICRPIATIDVAPAAASPQMQPGEARVQTFFASQGARNTVTDCGVKPLSSCLSEQMPFVLGNQGMQDRVDATLATYHLFKDAHAFSRPTAPSQSVFASNPDLGQIP
jgi:hypothetical protein